MMVAPVTFRPGARRCTRYQGEGMENSRCGSFARIGLPLAVRDPATAQAFEPGSGWGPAQAIQLPQATLGHCIALQENRVLPGSGLNVRTAFGIARDASFR